MRKLIVLISISYGLTACGGGGGSGTPSSTTTPAEATTWPPRSGSEFITYLDGKTFAMSGTGDTITFSGGTMVYNGPTSAFHLATIFTSQSSNYQINHSCVYTAGELQTTGFDSNGFSFKFNLISTNNFDPGGILNCKKHCGTCGYYESADINFTADSKCIVYDGDLFCTAN